MAEKVINLLGRYQHLAPPDQLCRETLAKLILQEIGTKVSIGRISVERGIIMLALSPVLKSEIILRKTFFLTAMREEIGDKAPKDIR